MDELTRTRSNNARLLRRLVLAPTPELVEQYDDASPHELVADVMAQPAANTSDRPRIDDDDDFWAPTQWWLSVMIDPSASFHERMTWFWHGHLTSGLEKASASSMFRQLQLLRTGALGNFRELLRAITLDPAMLWWLDGEGSVVDSPNENHARELMELFALGRQSGAYTEDDVKAGAKALTGYWVDDDADDRVEFEPEDALRQTVEFLGQRVRSVDDVIDTVCDHDACAVHITRQMYDHFVGGVPAPDLLDRLSSAFRSADLDVVPLATAMLTDESFLEGPAWRPRSGLEWFLALQRLLGTEMEMWPLEELAQTPLNPPNVAGWPGTDRWKSTGHVLAKGQIALDNSWDADTLDRSDPVTDVLRRAVLYEVSPTTHSALEELAGAVSGRREQSTLLHAAVAMCPEFSAI